MKRTILFATEGMESAGSEHGRSTQGDHRDNAGAPGLVACLLLVPEDAQAILSFLQKLAVSGHERSPDRPTFDGNASMQSAPEDSWLGHSEAAKCLGVSKSTLYRYVSQRRIECRKMAGRLEYRQSVLEKLKREQTRPARLSQQAGGIIPSAFSSGKWEER